jgi:hypothetical protein
MHSILDVAREMYPEIKTHNLDLDPNPDLLDDKIAEWRVINKPLLVLACDNHERHRESLEKIRNGYDKFAFTTPGFHKDKNHITNMDSLTAWCCDKAQPKVQHDVKKKHMFMFLVGKLHNHRLDLLESLAKHKLLDGMLLSLHNPAHVYPHLLPRKRVLPEEYEWEEIVRLGGFDPRYDNIDKKDSDISQAWHKHFGKVHKKIYQDSAFSIISETNIREGINYITEKTWIPIIAEHLFVNHANVGNNDFLQQLGFKLDFDGFTKYCENDHQSIADICKDLSGQNIKSMYQHSSDKRQHNRALALDESHWISYHKRNLKNFFG